MSGRMRVNSRQNTLTPESTHAWVNSLKLG